MDFFNSPEFPSHVDRLMKKHHVPGFAIALVQNDTIVSAGYGHASLDPPTPCTAETLFDIASSSKSMTAASVALLVEDKERHPEVQWDAKMSTLLPEDFVMPDTGYEGVTVEDILSHRSGLPRCLGAGATQPDDPRSVTRNLRNLTVAAPIRTKYMYNNLMYTVATYLVEKKTGISFPDFLQERFFGPLGMDSSNLQPERARARGLGDRMAMGHLWDKDRETYTGNPPVESPEAQGAGSIITSANDYLKWVKALMNQEGPITEDVYRGLTEPRSIVNPKTRDLTPFTSLRTDCAGLEMFYYRGHKVVGHDGGFSGFRSRHFFLPGIKFGAVLIGNSDGADSVIELLAQELTDAALHVPQDERTDWEAFFDAETKEIEAEVANAEEELRQKICPSITDVQPQKMPLSAYTGEYWNPGYKGFIVEVRDGHLFIDATKDRSMGFTMKFDHVCEQTKYIVHYSDFWEGGDWPFAGEFRFQNDRAIKMGLNIESELDEPIWFVRLPEESDEK